MSRILELAKKLKALADRGVGGEKYNAQAALEKLCRKHGIQLHELEEEQIKHQEFKVKRDEIKLFQQVASTVLGKDFSLLTAKGLANILFVECTNYQAVEIDAKYQHYLNAYKAEIGIFYKAFIQANNLYPKDSEGVEISDLEEEKVQEILKVQKMAKSITKSDFLKQLH